MRQTGVAVHGRGRRLFPLPSEKLSAKSKGATFKVKGKNGTCAPAIGPFRMTVMLGGPGGQCAQHTFRAPNCVVGGGRKQIKCK